MEPLLPPIQPLEPSPAVPTPGPVTRTASGARRTIATIVLSAGLLALGGTAVVLAASPDPSASPAPTTQPSDDGTTTPSTDEDRSTDGTKPDCPEGGHSGERNGTGGSQDDGGSSATPSEAPATTPAT